MPKNRAEKNGLGVWVCKPVKEEEDWFSKHDSFIKGAILGASVMYILALFLF
ncbi:hypothetical protein vBValSX1_63 [Vibrio phage vB_ValS_X1]|uniref:Uncharacterized protein n=1 Tax=Vibrio phage vB_ValS_X1 TaxID=2736341 RepID=A0A6M9Z6Y3_9CAUD|nr:hypothetical protein vBValSX1_63 [Vibrio phage vB_ValS_X1]